MATTTNESLVVAAIKANLAARLTDERSLPTNPFDSALFLLGRAESQADMIGVSLSTNDRQMIKAFLFDRLGIVGVVPLED